MEWVTSRVRRSVCAGFMFMLIAANAAANFTCERSGTEQ
jgi:hypothetical protein